MFIRLQRVLEWVEGVCSIASREARELAPEVLGTQGSESYSGGEKRPAIIDAFERARANYRYVIGQHFGL
jgi:hypothetical protein